MKSREGADKNHRREEEEMMIFSPLSLWVVIAIELSHTLATRLEKDKEVVVIVILDQGRNKVVIKTRSSSASSSLSSSSSSFVLSLCTIAMLVDPASILLFLPHKVLLVVSENRVKEGLERENDEE